MFNTIYRGRQRIEGVLAKNRALRSFADIAATVTAVAGPLVAGFTFSATDFVSVTSPFGQGSPREFAARAEKWHGSVYYIIVLDKTEEEGTNCFLLTAEVQMDFKVWIVTEAEYGRLEILRQMHNSIETLNL